MPDHNDEIPFARETVGLTRKSANVLGHIIELVGEEALQYCTICHGGEVELLESCASRIARLVHSVPIAPCKHLDTERCCNYCGRPCMTDPDFCKSCKEYKLVPERRCVECGEEVIG